VGEHAFVGEGMLERTAERMREEPADGTADTPADALTVEWTGSRST
jgi:hypothetical protein